MKRVIITMVAVVSIICLTLVGCGGTLPANSASNEAKFVGTWNAVEMAGEMTYDKSQVEAMRAFGLVDFFVNFNEDGTVVMNNKSGDNSFVLEGTWKADDATHITMTFEGNAFQATLDGDGLSLESNGTTMTLEKTDHRDPLTPAGSNAASESANDSGAAKETSSSSAAEPSQQADSTDADAKQENEASNSSGSSASSALYEASIDGADVVSDYKGNPALVVTYSWTNNSDETTSYATKLHAKCFQNGVQLDTSFVIDGIDSDGYMADVRPGYGTTFQLAYELKDTDSPVEVEVSELFNFNKEILVKKTFEL